MSDTQTELPLEPSEVVESIACGDCDVDSPGSLAEAIQQGWTDLIADDGLGWNYVGTCPECAKEEREFYRELEKKQKAKRKKKP